MPRGSAPTLVVLLGLVSLGLMPATASASGATAPCGPNSGRIASFRGRASVTFQSGATGEDPGEGGAEAVVMARNALNLKVSLPKVSVTKKRTDFVGPVTGGAVGVEDTFFNSGNGFSGSLSFAGGPLTAHDPNSGAAELVIDRRKGHCKYWLTLGFGVEATFSGDAEVEPVHEVGGDAYTRVHHIPRSLKLSEAEDLPAYLACEDEGPVPKDCYEFSGGWTPEFAVLALCGSVLAVNCADDQTTPLGAAEFAWNLHPTFEKHHKKSGHHAKS